MKHTQTKSHPACQRSEHVGNFSRAAQREARVTGAHLLHCGQLGEHTAPAGCPMATMSHIGTTSATPNLVGCRTTTSYAVGRRDLWHRWCRW
jgi:hypothetical protein